MNFVFIFALFFFARFRSTQLPCSCSRMARNHGKYGVFLGGGGFSGPEMRLPRHIWAKRGGAQACYASFFGGGVGVFCSQEEQKETKREEGGEEEDS